VERHVVLGIGDWSATVPVANVALATYGFSRCALIASGTLALQSACV
jgi:hypothetical protein